MLLLKTMIRRGAGQKTALVRVPIYNMPVSRLLIAWADSQALGKETMEVTQAVSNTTPRNNTFVFVAQLFG